MLPFSCVHIINVLLYLCLCIALMTPFPEKMSPKRIVLREDSTSLSLHAYNFIIVFVLQFCSFSSLGTSVIQFIIFHLSFISIMLIFC